MYQASIKSILVVISLGNMLPEGETDFPVFFLTTASESQKNKASKKNQFKALKSNYQSINIPEGTQTSDTCGIVWRTFLESYSL